MTARKAILSRLLVNQWDFSSVSNVLEVSIESGREDTTTFQASAKEFTVTDTTGTISQQGYFQNAAANEFEQEIAESVANSESLYVAALFGTDTTACPAYVARATNTSSLKIAAPVAGVMTLAGEWFHGSGIVRGLRAYSGAVSATGPLAYIDIGAAGTAGGQAWLFVQSKTGTITNATFTIQSDTVNTFASAQTECTFTVTGASLGGYEQAMTGTVNRYIRLNCTSMGGGTAFTVVAVVAVSGVTY